MGRTRGPQTRYSRRLETYLVGSVKAFQRRPYRPGQHGMAKTRNKASDYSIQLKEKQKVKILYGLREAQLERLFTRSSKSGSNTGETLLSLLERRVDNVIFRAGLARTRAQARQLVSHGLVYLNDKKMNIPSAIVSVGDSLTVTKGAPETDMDVPSWLTVNKQKHEVTIKALPAREEMPTEINEQLIVEFYSR